jgi:hypothetical protein
MEEVLLSMIGSYTSPISFLSFSLKKNPTNSQYEFAWYFCDIIFWEPILHYVYIYVVLYISINSTFILCIYWFVTCWNLKKKKKKSVKNICSIGHNVKLVQA